MHGLVIVDKPGGMTSHDVVHQARRLFRTKRVGHTGTLDPDATGVLVLCLGQATRLAEYLSAAQKHYVTEVVFGVETDTQDASGEVVAERDASELTEAAVSALLPRFRGTIKQVPPMVSAIHHQGKRLYELAREGVTVERAAREVEITTLQLTGFVSGAHPVATLAVTCSTGTYIRTLAADLGEAAGYGGMMRSLRREWVGDARQQFTLAEAHTLEDLQKHAEAGTLSEVVLPLTTALRGWTQVVLTAEGLKRIRQGQWIPLNRHPAEAWWLGPPPTSEGLVAVLDAQEGVCAVAKVIADRLQPVKVFAQE